MTKTGMHP